MSKQAAEDLFNISISDVDNSLLNLKTENQK
jgi:hypothetical protein